MSSPNQNPGERPVTGEAVKARLKWFNNPKGFGFVIPENEGIDAFLHVTTLKRAGVDNIGEGACMLCHIERGPRGAQVSEVVAMLDAGQQPESVISGPSLRQDNQDELQQLAGAVKWYAPEKGFGFVVAEDGQKDIFLHKRCLQRHGLTTIEPQVWLLMTVRTTPKGREVVDFEFMDG